MKKRPFKNLLIVMTDRHIGNLLVSLYAIKSVHQQLKPGQSAVCVIDHELLTLASFLLPQVRFIPYSLRGSKLSVVKKIHLLIKLFRALHAGAIDVAVDLYGHTESYLLCRLSGAGFISSYYSKPDIKHKYDWNNMSANLTPGHQVDFYLFPFIPLTGAIERAALKAPCDHKTLTDVQAVLAGLNVGEEKPLVIIHPGAGKAYKRWPVRHWQVLIKKLEHSNHQVLLIGSGKDKESIQAILAATDISPVNGFGHFNLIETIHLGFIASIMIGNDSGPTHIMATTPITVFSVFGPTDDKFWSPLSENSHVVRAVTECLTGCSKQYCQRSTSCLEAVLPQHVFEKIFLCKASECEY